MSEVTHILSQVESGDPSAAEKLLPLVYEELRRLAAGRMASERPEHTLQATALVHEAYLRLVEVDKAQHWNSRSHFYMAAAEAMRRILIESATRRRTLKRGGGFFRQSDNEHLLPGDTNTDEALLELNDLVDALGRVDSAAAVLVKLHLFAGLSIEEAGRTLGLSRSLAYANWKYARAWFVSHEKSVDS